jgi:NADP-dependent 3-hydroxy acid dehydrogenase YdfG
VSDHVAGKSIVVTGAGNGFGRLVSEKAAARGARLTCLDIDGDAAEATAAGIRGAGGIAQAVTADVCSPETMRAAVDTAARAHGGIDVMVNNAGIMPLAFLADHAAAMQAWHRCIDINFKGVVNGTAAAYDRMMAQGRGQIVNLSSIFGNYPVMGAAIYGATKAAVDYFSHAVRVETRGRIKVTVIKPTGVLTTGLGEGVVNRDASAGILGQHAVTFRDFVTRLTQGQALPEEIDPESTAYLSLDPAHIADAIIHAIDQPWGVAISDITVRATGDYYVL